MQIHKLPVCWGTTRVHLLFHCGGKRYGNCWVLRDSDSTEGDSKRKGPHRGPVLVKVQQVLWSQQGAACRCCDRQTFVSACSSFRLTSSSASGWMWDESIIYGWKPAGETLSSYKSFLWRQLGCTFGNGKFPCLWSKQGAFGEGQNIALQGNIKKETPP